MLVWFFTYSALTCRNPVIGLSYGESFSLGPSPGLQKYVCLDFNKKAIFLFILVTPVLVYFVSAARWLCQSLIIKILCFQHMVEVVSFFQVVDAPDSQEEVEQLDQPSFFCCIYRKQPGRGYKTNYKEHQIMPVLDDYSWTKLEPPLNVCKIVLQPTPSHYVAVV